MIEQTLEVPEKQTEPQTVPVCKKPYCQPKTVFLVVIGLLIMAGAVYGGMQIGKQSVVLPTAPPPEVRPTTSPTSILDETANWKTYTDSNLNYSFQYPPATCELQRFTGDTTFAVCYLPKGSDGGPKHNDGYVINHGYVSKSQLSVMGVTYCGAYPNDSSRCESFKIGKVMASIDWGTSSDASANVLISHPNGGAVTFALQPVIAESKEILKQILSTFKFLD